MTKGHTDKAIEQAMNQSWIYNQSWEDPAVDIKHFQIGKGDRVCMLTTGGDNVLDYLIEDPEYIDTFDMNEHQNFLVEMKLAVVRELEFETGFAILARQDYEKFVQAYPRLRKHLSEHARVWWDSNQHRMKNWHLSGSVKVAAYAGITLLYMLGCGSFFKELENMDPPTLEKQRELYNQKYRGRVQLAAKLGQRGMNSLIGFVGVPMRQYTMYDDRAEFLPQLLDYLCQETLLFQNNYFYAGYLRNGWTAECAPRYLTPEGYALVKERADRVRVITAKLADGVLSDQARRRYTRFVLLDHQDWLTEEQIAQSWKVLSQVGDKGALVGWRSFGELPFGCLSHLKYHVKGTIGRKEVNTYSDRVGMYNGLFCAELPTADMAPVLLNEPAWNQSLFNRIKTFGEMMLAPVYTALSRNHDEFLESFYASQAENYDAYRANMLHGKRSLMWALPWATKPKRILLFGGGTGDVLEYVKDLVPTFSEVVVLDLCGALLKQATKRAEKYGWKNVKIVQADATKWVPEEKFDIVISSYVFTMIPDWKAAINKAWEAVAPNGYLAATDFTTDHRYQFETSQWFWRKTFSYDHVNLNHEHHELIRSLGEGCAFRIENGSFPFIPLLRCPYYYAVQHKAGKKED